MHLSQNRQFWLERLRAEVAEIPDAECAVVSTMMLAEVEFAHGLDDAARAALSRSLQRFDLLHPGRWTSLVCRAAQLCGRLSENWLLEPEVLRGMQWLAQPEIVKYQTALPEQVHDIAIQVGRADVAGELASSAWPGQRANKLVDACRLAGWAGDTAELRRLLPLAREAILAAEPGPDHLRKPIDYWLVWACFSAGLLAETSELCEACGFPVSPELLFALRAAGEQANYATVRDGWLTKCIEAFRADTRNDQVYLSSQVRYCAETVRRLGDADGYSSAVRQFQQAVSAWTPNHDWIACAVQCDLAVLYAKANEAECSAECLDAAERLFRGEEPGVPTGRGSRSLMASILSAGHRDIGNRTLAVRFARRISHAGDRRWHLISALIVGGDISAAETELARLDSAEDRAGLIAHSLLTKFRIGTFPPIVLPLHETCNAEDEPRIVEPRGSRQRRGRRPLRTRTPSSKRASAEVPGQDDEADAKEHIVSKPATEIARELLATKKDGLEELRIHMFELDGDEEDDELDEKLHAEFAADFRHARAELTRSFGKPSRTGTEDDEMIPLNGVFRFAVWEVEGRLLFLAAAHEDRNAPIVLMVGTGS